MMDAVEASLITHGIAPAVILSERFATGPISAERAAAAHALAERAAGLSFTATLDGRRRTIPFDVALGNLLDSARAAACPRRSPARRASAPPAARGWSQERWR